MTHYHVGTNMPGYLPESDVYTVTSKRSAAAAVMDEVRRTLEGVEHPYRQGRASDGYVIVGDRDSSSGREIAHWWAPCSDPDCDGADE